MFTGRGSSPMTLPPHRKVGVNAPVNFKTIGGFRGWLREPAPPLEKFHLGLKLAIYMYARMQCAYLLLLPGYKLHELGPAPLQRKPGSAQRTSSCAIIPDTSTLLYIDVHG